ncbi:hypothetical protein [Streptomyces sp. NBC_00827]|uniref:hypothetical protein n=1 Tax=Streptomyces sp. NBC_00827 TaxID=2903677 RepID=UPI00386BA79B
MLASWYDEEGPAADVLHVGELPDPEPGPGEVRIRVSVSGLNPGDTKKRRGWLGSSMPCTASYPTIRPSGHLGDELGASLGIPGITAHRAVFADGPVDGRLVLVHGVLGAVGSLAAQLAHWGGATVIGTVRRSGDLDGVDPAVVSHAVALDAEDPAAAIRAYAPDGVHRVIEVSLSANADLDNAVTAPDAVIAASEPTPTTPNSPSGHCCSTTSLCACSAATTSPPRPSARPPAISPSTSATATPWRTSPRPTTGSTQANAGGY